jgi:hypothetical protein
MSAASGGVGMGAVFTIALPVVAQRPIGDDAHIAKPPSLEALEALLAGEP